MAFKMKSGNKPGFKSMGSSPAKKELIGNQANLPEHLKAKIDAAPGKMYDSPGKMYDSPAKQRSTKGGEGKDQDKIFDKNGKHVGNYVNGKKVMKSTTSAHGQLSDAKREFEQDKKDAKRKKSPAKQKVDPDAPGTPGTPGYEPPVKRSDLDAKGKATWDAHRAKTKEKKMLKTIDKISDEGWDKQAKPIPKKKPNLKENKDPMPSKKKARKQPTYEGTDEFRSVKDIPKKEFKKRVGKTTPTKQTKSKDPKPNFQIHSKEVNLAKKSGFGPATAFGGVKNPELVKNKKKAFSKKVMTDGKKTQVVYKGKELKGNWQAHQFKK